jgi:hypothetical protein
MSESQSTFTGNYGPMHSGEGHQVNLHAYYFGDGERLFRGGRDPRPTARDHLARLNSQFVEPPGYGSARTLLEEHGCAILVGRPGIGIRAAGQMLLSRLGGPGAVVQDESGTPDRQDEPVLDAARVAEGGLILLDPADAKDEHLLLIMRRLPSYQAELRERSAHLVVVLSEDRVDLVRMELRPLVVALRRPDALGVVRRHLKAAGIPFTEEQLRSNTGLRPRLAVDPIGKLAELVLLVGAARERLGAATGFDQWIAAAQEVLDELGDKVAAQVKELRSGPQRALLLATAMLSDAPADQVHLAATALTEAAAQPDDERPALERDDLAQRLAELKIAVDADGHVRFTTFGYDRAVRQYFWSNFPELRTSFRNWVGRVAVSPRIGPYHRGEFVSHFANQALRTDEPDDIVAVVEAWIRPGPQRARSLPSAAMALERGLGHRRHGVRFRQLIYGWSRDSALDTGTAYLAVALCADVIAATHPSEALVRLHHLVRRHSGDVRTAAREALLRVAHQDPREFQRLLDRVVTSLTGPRWEADFDLFLTVARPAELASRSASSSLFADPAARDRLVRGWQVVLFEKQSTYWAELAWEWLSAAENDRNPGVWLDTLAGACARPGVGSGRLYSVAREWAREPGADRQVRSRAALDLTNRMDRAQGIATPAPARHRSEEHI